MRFDPVSTANLAVGHVFRLAAALLAGSLLVTGCGLLGSGSPEVDETVRDENGAVVEGGKVGVNSLQLGDCFNDGDGIEVGDEVTDVVTVDAVPCSEPHDNEIYYMGALPDTDYPGEELVDELVVEQCLTVFESFAGIGYDESQLDIARIFPSEDNWADDDRGYICMVYDVSLAKLEGSMRDRGY